MDQDLSKKDTLERRPDFRLVLSRLENAIISGKDTARCRSLLTRRDLWLKLTPERQLEWARLFQGKEQAASARSGQRHALLRVHTAYQ